VILIIYYNRYHCPERDISKHPEDCNAVLEEVQILSSKLQSINKIINDELESQLEILEVLEDLLDKNKEEMNTVQYKLDKI